MYQRTTTIADLSELPPAVEAALRAHAETLQLHITDDLPAWTTRSINPRSASLVGKLLRRRANPDDPDSEHQTLVVIHPTHLIVVTSGAERGVEAVSTALARTSIRQDRADHPADEGFTVHGVIGAGRTPIDLVIGIGPPDGAGCRDAVRAAIEAAGHP